MSEVEFKIEKHYGCINNSSWKTEVNLVSWNGRDAKLDIRPWSPDHQKMGKGIALTMEEAVNLVEVLSKITRASPAPEESPVLGEQELEGLFSEG